MNKILKSLILGLSLATASFASTAEMISTDWLSSGDSKATLNTETGKEWLDLTVTDGMSIAQVQSMLDTTLSGWRLPTRSEVLTFMQASFTSTTLRNQQHAVLAGGAIGQDVIDFNNNVGLTIGSDRAFGIFLNDQKSELGGSDLLYSGARSGYYVYNNYNTSLSQYSSSDSFGVYLVSDGGTTLSSIENPSLNINNPEAPVNNATSSVPVSSSFILMGLAMAGFGSSLRKRKKA